MLPKNLTTRFGTVPLRFKIDPLTLNNLSVEVPNLVVDVGQPKI